MIKASRLAIPDLVLIEPTVHPDERGYFFESYNQRDFEQAIGRTATFVQDNQSLSRKNVLRGLHYQAVNPQAKLVRVIAGEIFDVAVDIRKESPTYRKWISAVLSAENKKQLWIPEGFAHGFLTLSDTAEVLYKTTRHHEPEHECLVSWNDPVLGIKWPLEGAPILSKADQRQTLKITALTSQIQRQR